MVQLSRDKTEKRTYGFAIGGQIPCQTAPRTSFLVEVVVVVVGCRSVKIGTCNARIEMEGIPSWEWLHPVASMYEINRSVGT